MKKATADGVARSTLEQTFFGQRAIASVADHDVVEDADAEDLHLRDS
jgi:hypothetical protein